MVHVLEGSVVVVYINPSTQQMSTHTVAAGQSFIPPVNPGAPGATPTLRPTRPGDVIQIEEGAPSPSLVIVPVPEPFISPIRLAPRNHGIPATGVITTAPNGD